MADGKYNIYSQQEIDEKLSALEQKVIKPSTEKQLKIKTLPVTTDTIYAIPVVTPNAVQGTFPAFTGSASTEDLDAFAQEVVSQFSTLGNSVQEKVETAIKNIEVPDTIEIDVTEDVINQIVSKVEQNIIAKQTAEKKAIAAIYPVGSIIQTVDETFNPNENGGIFKKSLGNNSNWKLIKTEETLSHTFTCVAQNAGGNAPPGKDIRLVSSLQDFNEQLETIWGSTERSVAGGGTTKDYWLHSDNYTSDFSWTIVKKDWETNWETYGGFFTKTGELFVRGLDLTGNNGTNIPFYVTIFKNRPCYTWKRTA